ncbi:hypothetical protein FHX48_000049 [Microbacterium halimionae]|uniref:Uncharacterized protein n=1 Tax=Microbacterium halimionae TaxID=1526413 RepID=A0A7W3JLA4_9MICO|nr:hypothetical protein [Microbacterium halimionae]MBA8814997.1 hypothetical protein [Microbacterium halimionae]NII94212.1 hypothetical protein [Microbacterium halimionae]
MTSAVVELDDTRARELVTARRISRIVTAGYFVAALIVFRDVLFAIPAVLSGDAVIVGDELVPFFNPSSQLLEQAAGEFNELTNGYEFRVRYSFLTTWLRHYQVLPFAILIVIPAIFAVAYRTVTWFLTDVFRSLSPVAIAIATVFPTTLIYMIMAYAKITHFYTLIVGLVLMTISVLLMLHALLFSRKGWVRRAVLSSVVTLLNPAVHYLILFAVFFATAGITLLLGEFARWIRTGGPRHLLSLPQRLVSFVREPHKRVAIKRVLHRWGQTTTGRGIVAACVFVFVTLIPYYLFVTYVALRGVENLSETVPGDYYFVRDASVSWLHMLSWDLAGIMDKVFTGDYLAKVPRYSNAVYSVLFFAPLVFAPMRRALIPTRAHRQLFGVIYVTTAFAMWATIGYAEPQWFPTFHRSLSAITRTLYATETPVGELALQISSTIVQVLRFPHRFQLILFMLAPLVMSLGLAWAIGGLHRRWLGQRDVAISAAFSPERARDSAILRATASVVVASVFFAPFWANANYRTVFGSGDFGTFLAPYPVGDLKEVKRAIQALPEGKTVVLPPTETAKLVTDDNGIDHKFIDKFFIYYLDQPSFYYGLTGDSRNKYEFFLILRGIYYQQDWWINPARDMGIKYMLVNKKLRDNRGVGAEYLPNVEDYTGPAMERQEEMGFVEKRFENDTFILYELTDEAEPERQTLLIDSSWPAYLRLVWNRLELSRCYDFEYLPYYEQEGDRADDVIVYSDSPEEAVAVDAWAAKHPDAVFTPSPKIFAFNSDIVASSYYLSPMFREFLFFSNTKWNRTEVITPGVFGTLNGSFIAVPRATQFTVPVSVPEDGRYRVLMRGAVTHNALTIESPSLDYVHSAELKASPDAMQYFSEDTVYTEDRVPIDASSMSVSDLEQVIDDGAVPVNIRYEYQDLGVVEAKKGSHDVKFDKHDGNPMLVEGLVLVPEETYQNLSLDPGMQIVDSGAQLECNDTYEVFGSESEGYVDPAANDPNADLSEEELLALAAAGVPDLEPDESGGLGDDWLVLVLTGGLLLAAVITVRSRTRRRDDDDGSTFSTDSQQKDQ